MIDLLILYMTDQNCEIRAVFNPATFLFGPLEISLSVSEIHPIAVLFHVTVTLRTRSGAKWRARTPPVRPSACYAHSPVLNKYRVWRTKKVVKRRKEIYVPLFGLLLCKSLVWITNPNKYEFVSDEYISPVNMTKVSFNAIINTWNMI